MLAVIILGVIGAAAAQDDFFETYGYTKAIANCLGDDIYYGYLGEVASAERQCNGYQPNFGNILPTSPTFTAIVNTLGVPGAFPTGSFPGQVYYAGLQPPTVAGKKKRQAGQGPIFDAVALSDAIGKVQTAIGNFTCVLRLLNVIDDNFNINYQQSVNIYNTVVRDPNLRNDLITGISFCRDFSTCLPVEKLGSPIPVQLQRIMAFVKCERRTRLAACFKHDLRRNINQFDLSVLPSGGGGVRPDVIGQLMTILIGSESTDDLRLY
ncbi:uncharacterized protein LOC134768591 [Penaeus indicus]|uniref:uncharacterized protein LOC134768591 n=1 Tax=Penaeus indicus TaxID=29960 RepID=UPI00300C1712